MRNNQPVTQSEYALKDGCAIISRTDKKGQITDCNQEFIETSGFTRDDLIGQPHNLIRHPDMPAEAFRDMWATLKRDRPWSGTVKNRRKNGDHYWVKANVAPLPDGSGYSSVRTKASRDEISGAEALYAKLKSDAKLTLHEGRLAKGLRHKPSIRVGARLWLMLGLPLLTLLVIAADGLYNLKISSQAVSTLYEDRLVPIDRLAEINDLNHASMIELILTEEEHADPATLAKHKQAILENEAGITKAWATYLNKSISADEQKLADAHLALRTAMWVQIKQALSMLASGQGEEAHRLIHGELQDLRDKQEDSIDALKSFQVQASSDFYETSKRQLQSNFFRVLLAVAVGGGLSLWVGLWNRAHILSNLLAARKATRAIACGNLTCELPSSSEDELGDMLTDIAVMRNSLHELMTTIRHNAAALNEASTELADAANRSAESSASQASSASSMATAVEQLSVSIDMVEDRAAQASSATQEASQGSTEGGLVIEQAATKMQHIAGAINGAAQSITELDQLSSQISNIVSVIKEVADQTNLLALNAAIEAARAGEQGRGFAVVADEVRKLAERTGKATGEISTMINEIQLSTKRAVQEMTRSVTQADEGVALALQAGGSITDIQSGSSRVTQAVTDISHALKEQVIAAHEITSRLEDVAQHADTGSAAAKRVADSALGLKNLATQSKTLVERFQIS